MKIKFQPFEHKHDDTGSTTHVHTAGSSKHDHHDHHDHHNHEHEHGESCGCGHDHHEHTHEHGENGGHQ